jgi:hypothetical protein
LAKDGARVVAAVAERNFLFELVVFLKFLLFSPERHASILDRN